MVSKWTSRGALFLAGYFVVNFIVNIVDNEQVIDRASFPTKKDPDGPLVVGDSPENANEKNRSIHATESKIQEEDLIPRPVQKVIQKVPEIPKEFIEDFEREAKIIYSKSDDFLLFTLINGAYLELTLNWLCNVASFSSAIHRKALIVSLDKEACRIIRNDWKKVKCIYLNISDDDYNMPLRWGRQNYNNLLILRSLLLLTLTQLEVPFILFETDAVWLRDPMKFFQNQTLIDDADIIVPVKGYPHRGLTYTFDPMIVYPTNASLILMHELKSQLIKDPKLQDQDVLDELCRKQHCGLVCRQFEWSEVADGKWFKLAETEKTNPSPYIVNNNYYVGVNNKIARQALNGFWFLSVKKKCNLAKVRNLIRKYQK